MGRRAETTVRINPNGSATLQTDRIIERDGREIKRLKLRRVETGADVLVHTSRAQVLPGNCRLFIPGAETDFFLIEMAPQVRAVNWEFVPGEQWQSLSLRGCLHKFGLSPRDQDRRRFRLAFPYIVLIVPLNDKGLPDKPRLFFRNAPIRSLDDSLYFASITNYVRIADNGVFGRFCIGDVKASLSRNRPMESIDSILKHFWGAPFNNDWPENYKSYCKEVPELRTIWDWEYHSRIDPLWVLRADWVPVESSLRDVLENMKRNYHERTESLFGAMQKQLIRAPKWQNGQPAEQVGEYLASSSLSVLVQGTIVEIGDLLKVLQEEQETRTIKRFVESKTAGHVGVQFEEEQDVILFGDDFWERYALGEKASQIICVQGKKISAGTTIKTEDEHPTLPMFGSFKISALRKDDEGDVLVQVNEKEEWHYLTTSGRYIPGVVVLEPKLHRGAFVFSDKKLKPWDVIRIEENLLEEETQQGLHEQLVRVSEICEIESQGRDVYEVRFDHTDRWYRLYDQSGLRFTWRQWQYKFGRDSLMMNDQKVEIVPGTLWLMLDRESEEFRYGSLYEPVHFQVSERSDAHGLDVDLVVREGNAPIPVIRESQFVIPFDEKRVVVKRSLKLAETTIEEGMRIKRTHSEHNGLFGRDDQIEVLCLEESLQHDMNRGRRIILTNGMCLTVNGAALKELRWQDIDGQPILFSAKDIDAANKKTVSTRYRERHKERLKPGERVIYQGGDNRIPDKLIGKTAEVYSNCSCPVEHIEVRFEKEGDRRRALGKHFKRAGGEVSLEYQRLFSRAKTNGGFGVQADGRLIEVPLALLKEQSQLFSEYRGTVGSDALGQELRVGDIVTPHEVSFEGLGAYGRGMLGRPAVIISYQESQDFAVILFSENARGTLGYSTNCVRRLPKRYLKDQLLQRMGATFTRDIQKVNIFSEASALHVGACVRPRKGMNPEYGWGAVGPADLGVVVEQEEAEIMVAFANDQEWCGSIGDVEVIALKEGDKVTIRKDKEPVLGNGVSDKDEVGTIRSILLDGKLIVAFESNPTWYGYPEDLSIVL